MNIPYWNGSGPYPSVKVRMDFRNASPGDLMYHCHYIFHADFGMMAVIRVLPKDSVATIQPSMPTNKPPTAHSMHHGPEKICAFYIHGRCAENGNPVKVGGAE